jgi:hypothetical protein
MREPWPRQPFPTFPAGWTGRNELSGDFEDIGRINGKSHKNGLKMRESRKIWDIGQVEIADSGLLFAFQTKMAIYSRTNLQHQFMRGRLL